MILPNDTAERHAALREMIRNCEMNSRELRRSEYNMLDEKVSTSAALLFDPQSLRIEVGLPKSYGSEFVHEEDAARDDLERVIDADLSVLAQAVEWAHVWPSVFVKVFGRGDEIQVGMLSDPADFGTPHEDLDTIDELPYFTHWYTMTLSQFERRVAEHPKYQLVMQTTKEWASAPDRPMSQSLPPTLIIAQSTPNMIGSVNQMPEARTQAVVREPVVKLAELWWYDSRINDYRMATQFTPTLDFLWETTENPIELKRDHPFRQCCLLPHPGYLYGRSMMEKLIPLQARRTDVLKGIYRLNDLNLDPPIFFDGFPGLIEEAAERFMAPGGRKASPMPGASAKSMAPPMPPDVFVVVNQIDTMAARQWGLPQAYSAGEAQQGVRTGAQESELAMLGSPVLRQRAGRVASFIESVLTLKLRMRQRELERPLRKGGTSETEESVAVGETGGRVLLSQIPEELFVRVWGHSASPVSRAEIERKAVMLKREGAITNETLAELFSMPMPERIRRESQQMAKAAAQYKGMAMQLKEREVKAKEARANKP